jgi:hypothetical protein
MAKVKIQGHASGTGILTVTAPNTSSDRTITLPDETATLSTFDPDGAVTINDTGADVDFRVESDDDANIIFVDGGNDKVGIGTGTPTAKLEINQDGAALGTDWGSNTGLAIVSADAYLDIVSDDSGSAGSALAFKQVDGTTFENAWNIGRKTNGDGTGDGSLNFAYGTDAGQQQNTTLLSMTTDGRGLSQFTAKAWVNFDGQDTLTVKDSHNVSSVTDDATAQYTVNFSNDMANDDYCAVAHTHTGAGTNDVNVVQMPSTSRAVGSVGMQIMSALNTASTFDNGTDTKAIDILIFGD